MSFHRYEPSRDPSDHEELTLEVPDDRPEAPPIPAARGPHDPGAVARGVVFTPQGAVAVSKDQARLRKEAACPNCNYSIVGLKSDRCPECGIELMPALRAAARKARQREGLVREYTVAASLLGGGLLVALAGATLINGGAGALWYLIGFALTIPLAFIAYMTCCALWIGFDMPIAITALRLAAIYAWSDAVRIVLTLLMGEYLAIIAWMISMAVMFWLLNKWLELDFVDSIGVTLATGVVIFTVTMLIVHWTT